VKSGRADIFSLKIKDSEQEGVRKYLFSSETSDCIFGIDFSNWVGAEGTKVTGRTTYKSKDKWYGADVYGDKGTASAGINYQFPTTESLGGKFAFDAEYTDYISGGGTPSQFDSAYTVYRLYFMREYYKGEKQETRLTVGHNYYQLRGNNANSGQEFGAGLAFPKVFDWGKFNLVPKGYLGYVWDLKTKDDTGSTVNEFKGTVAQIGSDLYFAPDKNAKEFLFDFFANANYNDAADINGKQIKGRFTDITVGTAVDFELMKGIIATPSLSYIYYLEDEIGNGEDADILVCVTLRYNF
jgi:hypothetical protein